MPLIYTQLRENYSYNNRQRHLFQSSLIRVRTRLLSVIGPGVIFQAVALSFAVILFQFLSFFILRMVVRVKNISYDRRH